MGQGNKNRKRNLGNNTSGRYILGALDAITDNIFDFDQRGRGEYINTQIEKSKEIKALMDDNNIPRERALKIYNNSDVTNKEVKSTVLDGNNKENITNNNKEDITNNNTIEEALGSNASSRFKNRRAKSGAWSKLPRNLRYPYSSVDGTQDFLKFSIFEYRRQQFVARDQTELKSHLLGNIILPIPAQLVDSNTTDYGQGNMNFMNEGLIEFGSEVIEGNVQEAVDKANNLVKDMIAPQSRNMINNFFAAQAVNALSGQNNDLNQLMARSSGTVLNPNMELLFKGPTLRSFNYQFKLTPRFKKEAETIRTIIKAFKRNMAPKGAAGNFLKTPNIFEIQYVGKARDYLNRMKLCALKNVNVNYTGEGNWATYQDGSPISMLLTLSFTEVMPIYNEDYESYDDNSDGVGY